MYQNRFYTAKFSCPRTLLNWKITPNQQKFNSCTRITNSLAQHWNPQPKIILKLV